MCIRDRYSYREARRAIYDRNGHSLRAYYWGDYKHIELRWIATGVCGTYSSGYDYAGRVYGKTLPDLSKNELKRTGLVETKMCIRDRKRHRRS